MHYLFGKMFQSLHLLKLSRGQSSSTIIVEEPAAISSTSTPLQSPNTTYDVFLSFRGDIRYHIADWFYTELVRAGLNTFRNVEEIRTGKDIDVEIEKAIRESQVAVVLFSDDFASSAYCLDEVAMFMERRRRKEVELLLVHYNVRPSDMYKQKGSYGTAFARHEEKLGLLQGEELQKEKQRLQRHREALGQVANVAGLVYNGSYPWQLDLKEMNEQLPDNHFGKYKLSCSNKLDSPCPCSTPLSPKCCLQPEDLDYVNFKLMESP